MTNAIYINVLLADETELGLKALFSFFPESKQGAVSFALLLEERRHELFHAIEVLFTCTHRM